MSAVDQDVAPDLTDLDVPMSEAAPEPDADFNAAPPPLPELFDDKGKPVPYIIDLMLGRNGIKKESFKKKDDEGNETGELGVYFTADVLGKVVAPFDERELDLAFFDNFTRPAGRYTTFVRKGKGLSEVAHLGKVAGLAIDAYDTIGEMAKDLAVELRKKGEDRVQALAYIQWQWWSKEQEYTTSKGVTKKGKVVRYGMKNADEQDANGTYLPGITHKETGEQLVARAVITRLEPLP